MPPVGEGKHERRINLSQAVLGVTAVAAAIRPDLAASFSVLLAIAALMLFCSVYVNGWRYRVLNTAGTLVLVMALCSMIYTMQSARITDTAAQSAAQRRPAERSPLADANHVGDAPAVEAVDASRVETARPERQPGPEPRPDNSASPPSKRARTASPKVPDEPVTNRETTAETAAGTRSKRALIAQILPPYVHETDIYVEAVLRNDGEIPEVVLRANMVIATNDELVGQLYGPVMINETTIVKPGEALLLKYSFPVNIATLRKYLREVPADATLPVALSFRTYDPDGRTIDNQTVIGNIRVNGEAVVNGDSRYARADLLHDTILDAAHKRWLASRGLTQ